MYNEINNGNNKIFNNGNLGVRIIKTDMKIHFHIKA